MNDLKMPTVRIIRRFIRCYGKECFFEVIALSLLVVVVTVGLSVSSRTLPDREVSAVTFIRQAFFNMYGENYIQTMRPTSYPRIGGAISRTIQVARQEDEKRGKALLRLLDHRF